MTTTTPINPDDVSDCDYFGEYFAHSLKIARLYAQEYIEILTANLRAALRRDPSSSELLATYQLGQSGFRKRGFSLTKCPASVRRAAEQIGK